MKNLLLFAGLVFGVSTVHAVAPIRYVQISTGSITAQTGGINITSGTVSTSLQLPYLTSGQCVQSDTTGKLSSSGGACGGGGSGGSSALEVMVNSQRVSSPTATTSFLAGSNITLSSGLVGTTAQITIAATGGGVVSPATFSWTNSFGVSLSTLVVNQTNTGAVKAADFISTGTRNTVSIYAAGLPSGGLQNDNGGALNITMSTGSYAEPLVIYSSSTDAQLGSSRLRIIQRAPNYNDPGIWYEDYSNGSGGQIRIDANGQNGPNLEITGSSDSSHGRGKWEPFAEAGNGGFRLQAPNSRCWDNSGFETVGYWEPLSYGGGLFINGTDSTGCDSAVITSSAPGHIDFGTLNSHTVGLSAPRASTASWTFALPSTIANAGQVIYQASNNAPRNWEFTTLGTPGQVLTFQGPSAPTWTTVSGGSGSGIVSPGTFTWTNTGFGMSVSTISVSTITLATASIPVFVGTSPFVTSIPIDGIMCMGKHACTSGSEFTTQGSYATAFGNYALGAGGISSGGSNSAFGYSALGNAGNAQNTTAIGTFAGGNITNGLENTAVGSNSLSNTNFTTIRGNTALGTSAGGTGGGGGGDYNTFLGYRTDTGGAFITNATAIGATAVVNSSNTIQMGGSGNLAATVNMSTMTVSSGTVSTSLSLTYLTPSQCVQTDATGKLTSSGSTCGGGGAATNYSLQPATVTVRLDAGMTASSITIREALAVSTVSKTSNYTMTGRDHVIFASSTITAISTVTLPSAAALVGQEVIIWKNDRSTMPVSITPAVGDTIVGLSTISLTAFGMNQKLVSDGVNTWFPIGGIAHAPAFMGSNQDVAGAATLVASTTYSQAWEITQPCDTKAITFNVGATGGANMTYMIYDQYGNLKLSSGPFVIAGTGGQIVYMPRVNLQPGFYYLSMAVSNATATFTRYMSNLIGAGISAGAYSKSLGIDSSTGLPLASIGYPPSFDNSSSRSPAVILSCYNGAP